MHPAASGHLPVFVTAPGQPDVLLNAMVVLVVLLVLGAGLLYLRLHALPEHMAHGTSKTQMQLVGVLALLALFTHNHLFWIAALLLALVQFPDYARPLDSIARSLDKLTRRDPPQPAEVAPPPPPVEAVTPASEVELLPASAPRQRRA
jgi:hypothetical protein